MPKNKRRPRKQQRPASPPHAAHRPRTDQPGAAFGLVPAPPAPYPFLAPDRPVDLWPGSGPMWDDEDEWDEDDEDDEDEYDLSELWPAFLGAPVDPAEDGRSFTPEEHLAALSESEFVRRADELLAWLGEGRPVTSTGEPLPDDVAELVELLGLGIRPPSPTAPPALADVPEVELLWESLAGAGFIDVSDTTATPAEEIVAWPTTGSSTQDQHAKAGDLLLLTAFAYFLGGAGDLGLTMAQMPPLTYLALLAAAQPDGLRLEEPDDHGDHEDHEDLDDLDAEMVAEDLHVLTRAGILTLPDGVFRLPPELLNLLLVAAHAVTADLADEG